jgi:lysophospholipase L1-like esterase
MPWLSLFDQTNWGNNTTASNTANSTLNVPGWIDKIGAWSVDNTRIKSPLGTTYTYFLYRPEAGKRDARVVAKLEIDGGQKSYWLRLDPTGISGYYFIVDTAQNISVSKAVSGTNTTLRSITAATWGYVAGQNYEIDFSVKGTGTTNLYLVITNTTTNTVVYTMAALTDTTASLQSTGTLGLSFFNGASFFSRVAYYEDVASIDATTYTLQGGSSTVVVNNPVTYTVALPTGTTIPTPVTVTFSDNSGGGSFAPASVQLSTENPSATTSYTPSSIGNKSISTTNSGSLANPSSVSLSVVVATVTRILPTDTKLIRSPYNWTTRNGYLETNNSGAYIKLKFTGVSLTLNQDLTHLTSASVSAGNYPTLRWSVDNGTWTTRLLTSSDTTLTIANGLSAGTHTCTLWVNSLSFNIERWTTPLSSVRFNYFDVAIGEQFLQADSLTQKAVFFGDSITEGISLNAGTNATHSANQAFSAMLADTLQVEYAQIGFGFLGWNATGSGVPAFPSSWNLQAQGLSRSFSPAPDMVFVNLGTNDNNDVNVQTAIATWLPQARSAFGTSTKIFIIVPFGRYVVSGIQAAFTAYKLANPNDNTYLIDLGTSASIGLVSGSTANQYAGDGKHPNTHCTTRLVGLLVNQISRFNNIKFNYRVTSRKR